MNNDVVDVYCIHVYDLLLWLMHVAYSHSVKLLVLLLLHLMVL